MLSPRKVVITGTVTGIGREIAKKFLKQGYEVIGIDDNVLVPHLVHASYTHVIADVRHKDLLPKIDDVNYLITCAGVVDACKDPIGVNLKGVINVSEMYALQPRIESVLHICSASAHNGSEYPWYVASKGGVLAYTKWLAQEVAKYGATCNSISPGGVITRSNMGILGDSKKREAAMKETLLGRWATISEIADWVFFMTVHNLSATGQDILIDNGEMLKSNFID